MYNVPRDAWNTSHLIEKAMDLIDRDEDDLYDESKHIARTVMY